jgi:Ser/Thr protein kinase RdoA (MazF antagonist)
VLLKERAPYLAEEEFDYQLRAHRELARAGAPVPAVPEAIADLVAARAPSGRAFSVQAFVHGRAPCAESEKDLAEIGLAVARFHAASAAVEPPAPGMRQLEPRDRFGKARRYVRLLERTLPARVGGVVDDLRDRLDRAAAAVDPSAPRVLQHGDVDLPNALLTPNGCVLVDLDDMHCDPRVSDIAWLITLTAGMARTPDLPGYAFRDAWGVSLGDAVVAGYERCSRLSAAERRQFPFWLIASVVCAAVDAFFHDDWLVQRSRLADELARGLHLIDSSSHAVTRTL